jgi:hypothetical protein
MESGDALLASPGTAAITQNEKRSVYLLLDIAINESKIANSSTAFQRCVWEQ